MGFLSLPSLNNRVGRQGKQNYLPCLWTLCQFSPAILECRFVLPSQGEDMNELNSLTAPNWYAIGSLLIQFAFLVAGVALARDFLRTLRRFQEQLGALLRVSIASAPGDTNAPASATKISAAENGPYWFAPGEPREPQAASGPALTPPAAPSRFSVARRGVALWLQAPIRSSGVAPWRRVVNWLQAPAGS